jgi:hypothetical protein
MPKSYNFLPKTPIIALHRIPNLKNNINIEKS